MQITVTVNNSSAPFQKKLLALLAEHASNVAVAEPDNRWTPKRARAYYDRLPPRAQQILLAAVENDGHIEADEVRHGGRSLRGCTSAFRQVLEDGVRAGRWPAALPVPVESIYGGGRVVRFDMPGYGTPADPHQAFVDALLSKG
ncbi:hypothetical protein [Kitasatospora sp. NPDC087315]|uniref:hypothetical protein n=1 Tax=Kitasatospora sp. NPDC087315 TaxID=3364069 RepID=UPI0038125884